MYKYIGREPDSFSFCDIYEAEIIPCPFVLPGSSKEKISSLFPSVYMYV